MTLNDKSNIQKNELIRVIKLILQCAKVDALHNNHYGLI